MEPLLKLVGVLLITLALLHSAFPKYFKWSESLKSLPLISRQMMYVHTFFIALALLLMGLLCVSSSELLNTTKLGQRICLGLGAFWGARLFIQFFGYSPQLWRRKKFETTIHIAFVVLWSFLTFVFMITALA